MNTLRDNLRKKNSVKLLIILLSVLLGISIVALCISLVIGYINQSKPTSVSVPDNIITPEKSKFDSADFTAALPNSAKAEGLYLYSANPNDNTSFNVSNMFPGDSFTKYYCVRTTYKNSVTVRYHADIRQGGEKLAEVLKCRIKLLTTGEVLYDGVIKDMPKSLNHTLPYIQSRGESELYYEITAYLDTSVGNDYANRSLTADFRWWVEEENNLDNPNTGVFVTMTPWIIISAAFVLVIILLVLKRRKKGGSKMSNNKTAKKLTSGIITIVILSICLCVTTFALIWSTVSQENNFFHTGNVKINLNDGKPIIEEHEFIFEPGMTVKKEFFIENQSTWDVYYKLYFDNVDGGLADVLQITVKYGDKTLYSGTANELNRTAVQAADDTLKIGERKQLNVYFYYPNTSGNQTQNTCLSFDLCADAVQTKNNPNKLF